MKQTRPSSILSAASFAALSTTDTSSGNKYLPPASCVMFVLTRDATRRWRRTMYRNYAQC